VVLLVVLAACDRCGERKASAPAAQAAAARSPAIPARRNWSRPRVPPSLVQTWSTAETSNTADAWNAVADGYARERARCTDDCLDAAYAVVLARKNAVAADPQLQPPAGDGPVALPEAVRTLVASLDDYVKLAPASDPDVTDMKFLAANALFRWHQDDANERLEELLRDHRDDPSAEYAANMLLDALMRANKLDELKLWVDDLLGDVAFLAGKDQLKQTLERLRAQLAAP